MSDRDTLQHLEHAAAGVFNAARNILRRREAVLNLPYDRKYNGRLGVIDDVMLAPDGRILCLFYVYRKERRTILNSDCDSRSYRPLVTLILTPMCRLGDLSKEPS